MKLEILDVHYSGSLQEHVIQFLVVSGSSVCRFTSFVKDIEDIKKDLTKITDRLDEYLKEGK